MECWYCTNCIQEGTGILGIDQGRHQTRNRDKDRILCPRGGTKFPGKFCSGDTSPG